MAAPKKKTAAWRLFHFKYRTEVPTMFLFGPQYLEKAGYAISGDANLDSERARNLTLSLQTPAGMALLYHEGASIEIMSKEDMVSVYEDIQEHLQDWDRVTQRGIYNLRSDESLKLLGDLEKFEAIAMLLYPLVKRIEPAESYGDGIRDQIIRMNRARNPNQTNAFLRRKITDNDGQLRPYISIVDRIRPRFLGE